MKCNVSSLRSGVVLDNFLALVLFLSSGDVLGSFFELSGHLGVVF